MVSHRSEASLAVRVFLEGRFGLHLPGDSLPGNLSLLVPDPWLEISPQNRVVVLVELEEKQRLLPRPFELAPLAAHWVVCSVIEFLTKNDCTHVVFTGYLYLFTTFLHVVKFLILNRSQITIWISLAYFLGVICPFNSYSKYYVRAMIRTPPAWQDEKNKREQRRVVAYNIKTVVTGCHTRPASE